MMNEALDILRDVPPMIGIGWVVWFGTGALLVLWYRKAQAAEAFAPVPARPVARAKSGPRPTAAARTAAHSAPAVDAIPSLDLSALDATVPVLPKGKPKAAPIVVGDPFGDLATLLDQPSAQSESPKFRTPGESPILNSAGEPMK